MIADRDRLAFVESDEELNDLPDGTIVEAVGRPYQVRWDDPVFGRMYYDLTRAGTLLYLSPPATVLWTPGEAL
jgi:hypothetical protein